MIIGHLLFSMIDHKNPADSYHYNWIPNTKTWNTQFKIWNTQLSQKEVGKYPIAPNPYLELWLGMSAIFQKLSKILK